MATVRVNWNSYGDGGEAFCSRCGDSIGYLNWRELRYLAGTDSGAVCFDCEADKLSDFYPTALIMALEDAWRLTIDDMVFYGEWDNLVSPWGSKGDRFLVPWSEMVAREREMNGEFIELPRSWIDGEMGRTLPCLVSANLKNFQDGEYCCDA